MRICDDGAEYKDLLFWSLSSLGIIDTTYKRSGIASYAWSSYQGYYVKYIPDETEYFFRIGVDFNNITNGQTGYPLIVYHNYPTCLVSLAFIGDTKLVTAYTGLGITPLATGIIPLSTNHTWHLLECYIKIADSGGRVITYWDGVKDIDFTGDTKPGADTTINAFGMAGGYGGYMNIDDIAVNNTSNADGKNDNSWCGDGHYKILTPNGNGDTNQWLGNDGNQTDNYLQVDEYPADNDTTYVTSSGVGLRDMYNLTDYSGTNEVITRIWAEGRAEDNTAAGGQIKLGFKTNGTVYLSSGITLPSTYTRVLGDSWKVYPPSGVPWVKNNLDQIQFVIESE